MQFLPDIKTLITIGPFSITFYAVFILSGALIGYYFVKKTFIKMGYSPTLIEDFAFYLLPIAIIGARLWYVIFEWHQYQNNPIKVFYIHEGGLAIHGGLLFGIAFGIYYFRKRKINVFRVADVILPFVLLAQAIGRWGNFMNQEAYGRIVSESYYNYFPTFIKNMMFIDNAYREPTFLYESIGNLIGFILIYFVFRKFGRKKYGDIAFAYLAYYGVLRFVIESFRSDSLMIFGLKTAQLISLIFIAIGIFGIMKKTKLKPIVGFDLDGTLIQSERLIIDSFKHTFKTLRPELEITEQQYHEFLGFTLKDTFSKYDEDYEKYITVYREFNLKNHDACIELYDGAFELLQKLKQDGYKVAVISSKKTDLVKHALKLKNIAQFVDCVVGYDDVTLHKPDPQPLKKACEILNESHDAFIYIGDSEQDILSAKNLGAFSIGVLFDPYRKEAMLKMNADALVNELSQCYNIIKEDRVWQNSMI